jgi:hypothetical protein
MNEKMTVGAIFAHFLQIIENSNFVEATRVARWCIFIPIWVHFGGLLEWIMMVYFMAIWYA